MQNVFCFYVPEPHPQYKSDAINQSIKCIAQENVTIKRMDKTNEKENKTYSREKYELAEVVSLIVD